MVSLCHRGAYVLTAGGRSALIDSNCGAVLDAGEPYRTQRPFRHEARGSSVAVRPDVAREIAAVAGLRASAGTSPFALGSVRISTPAFLLDRLVYQTVAEGGDALTIEETALRFLREVIGSCGEVGPNRQEPVRARWRRRRRDAVEAAKELLAARFTEPLHLDEVARIAGVSPYHLCRIFRQDTGDTLRRYRLRLRLRAAIQRVLGGEDLSRLAQELGFASHSHFSAAFRREFGTSPSQFRRQSWRTRLHATDYRPRPLG